MRTLVFSLKKAASGQDFIHEKANLTHTFLQPSPVSTGGGPANSATPAPGPKEVDIEVHFDRGTISPTVRSLVKISGTNYSIDFPIGAFGANVQVTVSLKNMSEYTSYVVSASPSCKKLHASFHSHE
jgi:hypothetical protein